MIAKKKPKRGQKVQYHWNQCEMSKMCKIWFIMIFFYVYGIVQVLNVQNLKFDYFWHEQRQRCEESTRRTRKISNGNFLLGIRITIHFFTHEIDTVRIKVKCEKKCLNVAEY